MFQEMLVAGNGGGSSFLNDGDYLYYSFTSSSNGGIANTFPLTVSSAYQLTMVYHRSSSKNTLTYESNGAMKVLIYGVKNGEVTQLVKNDSGTSGTFTQDISGYDYVFANMMNNGSTRTFTFSVS